MTKSELREMIKKTTAEYVQSGGSIEVCKPQKTPKQKVTRGSLSWGGKSMRMGSGWA